MWSVNDGLSGNLWKPARNLWGWFEVSGTIRHWRTTRYKKQVVLTFVSNRSLFFAVKKLSYACFKGIRWLYTVILTVIFLTLFTVSAWKLLQVGLFERWKMYSVVFTSCISHFTPYFSELGSNTFAPQFLGMMTLFTHTSSPELLHSLITYLLGSSYNCTKTFKITIKFLLVF